MDLVVYVDFTVVSALSQEALRARSNFRDGVAAGIATRRKAAAYPEISSLVPLAVEDHGRLGDEALQLVRLLQHNARRLFDVYTRAWAVRSRDTRPTRS